MIADRVGRVNAGKALTVYQLTQWAEIRRDSWTTAAPGSMACRAVIQTMGKVPNGRGERIRTSGLYVPNVALYQAKLHPE